MPTSTRSKTFTRRKTFRRKVKPTASVKGYQLNALRRQMWKMRPKPESKYFDTNVSGTILNVGIIRELFDPSQGTGVTEMIGDSCWLKNWLMRVAITPNETAGLNYVRLIMFQDKQANGAAALPLVTDVLTSADYLSPLNVTNWQRFKVRFDKMYTVDNDANGSQVDKIFRKFRIQYRENTTNPVTNGLYLLLISNQAANGPTVDFYSRIKFTEI